MLFPVEPHADILREDGIFHGVFIPVLGAELPGAAPAGGAVLLAGAPVLLGGEVQRGGPAIQEQSDQHEFRGMGRPADGKGALHQNGETPQQVKEVHAVLVGVGHNCRRPQDRNRQQRPREDAALLLFLHRPALPFRLARFFEAAGAGCRRQKNNRLRVEIYLWKWLILMNSRSLQTATGYMHRGKRSKRLRIPLQTAVLIFYCLRAAAEARLC